MSLVEHKKTNQTAKEEIVAIGDSHIGVFLSPLFQEAFPQSSFDITIIRGATASGLENPNSKTQAYPTFKAALEKTKASKAIIILGEVDTGFVIWYRAEKYKASLMEMTEKAVKTYSQFLLEVKKLGFSVICISTPLPTIADDNNWGEIASARKDVKASQKERTKLTLGFNNAIKSICDKNDIVYISLDAESMGDDNLVKKEILNPNPHDHHYDRTKYAEMIITKLKEII